MGWLAGSGWVALEQIVSVAPPVWRCSSCSVHVGNSVKQGHHMPLVLNLDTGRITSQCHVVVNDMELVKTQARLSNEGQTALYEGRTSVCLARGSNDMIISVVSTNQPRDNDPTLAHFRLT